MGGTTGSGAWCAARRHDGDGGSGSRWAAGCDGGGLGYSHSQGPSPHSPAPLANGARRGACSAAEPGKLSVVCRHRVTRW